MLSHQGTLFVLLCLDADSESFSTQYPSHFRTKETEIQKYGTLTIRVNARVNLFAIVDLRRFTETRLNPFTGKEAEGPRGQ